MIIKTKQFLAPFITIAVFIVMIWIAPGFWIWMEGKPKLFDQDQIHKVYGQYEIAVDEEDWMRAFILTSELDYTSRNSEYQFKALVETSELYLKLECQFPDQIEFDSKKEIAHIAIHKEGLGLGPSP